MAEKIQNLTVERIDIGVELCGCLKQRKKKLGQTCDPVWVVGRERD